VNALIADEIWHLRDSGEISDALAALAWMTVALEARD
jgi:hypothetical protein